MRIISGLKQVGERRIHKFLLSRLLVIAAIIAIPILMFLLFNESMTNVFKMAWVPPSMRNFVLIFTPWLFSVGWVFMLILFANRTSGSIDAIDVNFKVVPNRYKIFYGINAIVVMVIFSFPIFTPIVCILAFASLGYRLGTIRKDWEKNDKTPILAIILTIIFAVFPLIISIAVLPDMITFSGYIWSKYWVPLINPLYSLSMALSTALTFGSLIILIKAGVSEYEQVKTLADKKDLNIKWVKWFEVIVFAFLVFLEYEQLAFKQIFYYAGLIIVIFVFIVNFIKGRSMQMDFRSYWIGYILTIILLGANALSLNQLGFGQAVKNASVIISAAMYIILYIVVFLRYKED